MLMAICALAIRIKKIFYGGLVCFVLTRINIQRKVNLCMSLTEYFKTQIPK